MHRKSTDLEYYRDKKLVIDADGVEVTLPVDQLDSADRAEEAARSAKADADRVERVASTTSWSGDKLTVFGKTSPSLRGPKGDPGDVSKTQLDAAIEDVKATINRAKPVYFTRGESGWSFVGPTPEGWSFWGLGRVYPPAGEYWVEMSDGATVEVRPSGMNVPLKQATMATIAEGDFLLAMNPAPGQTIKITPIT